MEGGDPEVLGDVGLEAYGGAWSPAGVIVFAPGLSVSAGLLRMSASGGDARPATALDTSRAELGHLHPQFLPDGRHFLFSTLPARQGKFDTFVGSLDSTAVQYVLSVESGATFAEPGYLLFSRRQRLVAQPFDATRRQLSGEPMVLGDASAITQTFSEPVVSASTTGVLGYLTAPFANTRLAWFDLAGTETGSVAGPPGQVSEIVLSPDDRRAAVLRDTGAGEADIWIVDLDHGAPTRFAYGSGTLYTLGVWSPDGTQLAFTNNRRGEPEMFTKATTGTTQDEVSVLGTTAPFVWASSWSPDGRFLVYHEITKTSLSLYVVPLRGDRTPRPYMLPPADTYFGPDARVSPDGRWLAYDAVTSGAHQLYVQSFPTPGTRYRVGPLPAEVFGGPFVQHGIWDRSGTRLGWIGADGRTLFAIDVRPGPEFRAGAPRVLGTLPSGFSTVDMTSDFTRLLAAVPVKDATHPSATIVLDWTSALKK